MVWLLASNVCDSRMAYSSRKFPRWKDTVARAFSTASLPRRSSLGGSDQRNRARRSMLALCCRASHTQATCSGENVRFLLGVPLARGGVDGDGVALGLPMLPSWEAGLSPNPSPTLAPVPNIPSGSSASKQAELPSIQLAKLAASPGLGRARGGGSSSLFLLLSLR